MQKNKVNDNIQIVMPIGYQQTVEFYSPTYDTNLKKESITPDLRSTIYWNPNVQTDSLGMARVSFYTADSKTDYNVVIEGICKSGYIIFSNEKNISRRNGMY